MALVNVIRWIRDAQREGYAVGAFNANNLEQMQAIVAAAEAESAPVILQISTNALRYIGHGDTFRGLEYAACMGRVAAESVRVPVSLHLDHADREHVRRAVELGFTSVMFDGSDLPLDENAGIARELVALAHGAGVSVEAEVGGVPRSIGGVVQGHSELTEPEDAVLFTRAAGVDTLAVGIGSVHAVQRKEVSLDLERLRAIRERVAVPLVLHGSSGVHDAHIAEGVRLGLCKVNIATQLSGAFTAAVREALAADASVVDPRKYLGPGREAMVAATRERIRFLGAAGRAG